MIAPLSTTANELQFCYCLNKIQKAAILCYERVHRFSNKTKALTQILFLARKPCSSDASCCSSLKIDVSQKTTSGNIIEKERSSNSHMVITLYVSMALSKMFQVHCIYTYKQELFVLV